MPKQPRVLSPEQQQQTTTRLVNSVPKTIYSNTHRTEKDSSTSIPLQGFNSLKIGLTQPFGNIFIHHKLW